MSFFEGFKSQTRVTESLLTEGQCKALFISTLVGDKWFDAFDQVFESNLPPTLKKRIDAYAKSNTEITSDKWGELKGYLESIPKQHCSQCKHISECKGSIGKFVKFLDTINAQNVAKSIDNTVIMYLGLTLGGDELFSVESTYELPGSEMPRMRYKEKKDFMQLIQKDPVRLDTESMVGILSLLKPNFDE